MMARYFTHTYNTSYSNKNTALAMANHNSFLKQFADLSVFFTKFLHFFLYHRHMIDDRL